MGHLIRMVNLLVRCGETDQGLASMLRDTMEEDLQQRWNHFISGTVADTNKKNETNLVGCVQVQWTPSQRRLLKRGHLSD